jgi:alpha-ketoglutarate-dependent taurine dioxygenase
MMPEKSHSPLSTADFVVTELSLLRQQLYAEVFPLVIEAEDRSAASSSMYDWLEKKHQIILDQSSRNGAVLFRGFPIESDTDFDKFVDGFKLKNFTYSDSLSNAVRRNRTAKVFTANEAPPSVSIYLHHEMAQTPVFPSRLFFFCETAPETGGATPLCRSDILFQQLQLVAPDFVHSCLSLGVRYSNVMPFVEDLESGQGRSWGSTLGVKSKAEAEAKLLALGYQWQWLRDDDLQVTTPALPAARELDDGRTVFFNQLVAAFRGWSDKRNQGEKSIYFGDGSDISEKDMAITIELSDKLTFDLEWKAGDVALVDNFVVMHGRRPYEGRRSILASLVAPD